MEDELITFPTAKLAKEKGFDILNTLIGSHHYFFKSDETLIQGDSFAKHLLYHRPTQSLLASWFREIHGIYVTALPFRDLEDEIELCWYYSLVDDSEKINEILCNEDHLGASDNFDTYKQTMEIGLVQALKLI